MNAREAPLPDESEALYDVLESLPLMDDLFLRMQAQNIAMVNAHIIDVEKAMYRQYMEEERTPVPQALFTSALSQMWIFALYELLRTWRQRVQEMLVHGKQFVAGQVQATVIPAEPDHTTNLPFLHARARAERDQEFLKQMREARDLIEMPYRELEGVRVTLAKHEVPKIKGAKAANAGYARIDPLTGSMNYQFIDKDGYSNMASRHSIVQHILRAFGAVPDDT